MESLRVDKISFAFVIVSAFLFILGWSALSNYNGFNSILMQWVADVLKVINPAPNPNVQVATSGGFYITEERMLLAIFVLSAVMSVVSLSKLIIDKVKGKRLLTFASMLAVSITLIGCNIYTIYVS